MSATLSATLFTSMSATISNSMLANFVGRYVGHHVVHLVGQLVHLHVGHHNVVSTLCESSDALTEWKSKSMADGLTGIGARDACASKNASGAWKLQQSAELNVNSSMLYGFEILPLKRCRISLLVKSQIIMIKDDQLTSLPWNRSLRVSD